MTEDQRATLAPLSDLAVLTLTIWGEADGEPIESQVAVGCVIRNRLSLRKGRFGDTYPDVCWAPKQFSCWNERDPNFDKLWQRGQELAHGAWLYSYDGTLGWAQLRWIAAGITSGAIRDNTKGSCHYLTHTLFDSQPPRWARSEMPVAQKGQHLFFAGVA